MKLGYIGLGKMGFNMVERLLEKGHEVVASNRSIEKVREIEKKGAIGDNEEEDNAACQAHSVNIREANE